MTWELAWMLRTYRTCNSMGGFSKYEFYNKLLGSVTLLRVTLSVTWIQPHTYTYTYTHTHTHTHTHIYIYIYIFVYTLSIC